MQSLALQDAVADYGETRVLGPLSLTIDPGERIALVGKSGVGKSSLLSVMYAKWRDREATLMPQDLGLVPTLSVFHNVYMGGLARNRAWYNLATLLRPFHRDRQTIQPLLERLGLGDKTRSPCGELSGGQRQRVAAARAIHQGGGILLADEPASALDGPQAEVVMQMLVDAFPTAVLAMHDLDLALRYCNRVLGIHDGGIVIDQPSDRLTANDLMPLY